uniref:plasmid maintenance protein n=1 Tax=Borreliella bavariensis TaxID=664662 RepID=UPI001C002763
MYGSVIIIITKNKIEKYQTINYFNKCNFKCKEILFILLNLDICKDKKIKIMKNRIHRRENECQIYIRGSILLIFKDNVRKFYSTTQKY